MSAPSPPSCRCGRPQAYRQGDLDLTCAGCGSRPSHCDCPPIPRPQVVSLASIEPERVEWLWSGYLPLGKLVVLDGDPGVGKSAVSLDLGARITTGSPMPDGSLPRKGAVLVLTAEDGLADTVRPRLDAAGGDPAQVAAITEIAGAGADGEPFTRPVALPGDLPAVEAVIAEHGVVLMIVDVLMAYLAGKVNAHVDQDVRRALHPLAAMAGRTDCCVLVLRHLNKTAGTQPVYRGGGSIGIIGAARAALLCAADPDDPTGRTRILAPVKNNLAAPPPALAYQLVPDDLRGAVRVEWLGPSARKAASLLAEPADPDERGDRDEAAGWLRGYLADHGGEAAAGEVLRAGRADGFGERRLQRARARAGVVTGKSAFTGGWTWRLDPHQGDTAPIYPSSSSPSSPSAAETRVSAGQDQDVKATPRPAAQGDTSPQDDAQGDEDDEGDGVTGVRGPVSPSAIVRDLLGGAPVPDLPAGFTPGEDGRRRMGESHGRPTAGAAALPADLADEPPAAVTDGPVSTGRHAGPRDGPRVFTIGEDGRCSACGKARQYHWKGRCQ